MSGRGSQTAADMVRSLGLVLVVIAVLLFIGPARALVMPGSDRPTAVGYSDAVRGFTQVTKVPALAPVGLPTTWRANAAALARHRGLEQLHIGWALPGGRYAGLDEGVGDARRLVRDVLGRRGLTSTGTTTVAGARWDVRRSSRGEEALVRTVAGNTVVVTGSGTDVQLRLLAAALH